jgi:hypothetical protein
MADVEEAPVEETPVEEEEEEQPAEGDEEEPMADEPLAVEEDDVPTGATADIKLFGKWNFDEIEVRDISLLVSIV